MLVNEQIPHGTFQWLPDKFSFVMNTLTQKSLPFKEDGRDIQYPVEALLAFKAKDWAKLKELRKKYPIPTQKK